MTRASAIESLKTISEYLETTEAAELPADMLDKEVLKWAIVDMQTASKWNETCQALWIENEELEEKLKNSIPKDVDCTKCAWYNMPMCNECIYNSGKNCYLEKG